MKSAEIRESFLKFFESKGCRRLPSSSLVPDDPSLLLTSAGMVQFKPVFLGVTTYDFTRAATCQKCARTTDIDIIGTTGRHHSFFEMLGNFSFGDYFKREACTWAWEYSTDVLGLDPDRLWISIYEDDDAAEAIWRGELGLPPDRIVRMGEQDNFWSAGPTGPCGPCSELYYDQGPELGCGRPDCAPGCDCDRYVEYWNLVFMQYDRQEDGTLVPLPKQNIDTGLGLERLAAILQGVPTNFETDILGEIMAEASAVTGVAYGAAARSDVSLRILADHSRALAFLIADGVLPSNESRGYVLRRLLRRAVRHGRLLGVSGSFLVRLVDVTIREMGDAYPELVEHAELIRRIVAAEEERFSATLRQGMALLEAEIERTQQTHSHSFDGTVAFTLHDTYGFPIELTAEIVGEQGLSVDMTAFEAEMAEQRERGRGAAKGESWAAAGSAGYAGLPATEFVGYEDDEAEATVLAIVVDGARVDTLSAGQPAEIVLDGTPFYGEQGGQVGDTGRISAAGGDLVVTDTRIALPGLTAHRGSLESGSLSVGDRVHAAIDVRRRERIRRNHTATHLLHWALRLVLGEHVKQSGSYVAPDRLRFDYTHFEAPEPEQMRRVEELVNAKIMEDHAVRAYETSLASAREAGVTALFGEKYGEFVRVLEIGNFSRELCGGTHVSRTSELGFLKITSEGSVGANVRRVEAVTSFGAMRVVYEEERILRAAADVLRARPAEVADKVEQLAKRAKDAETSAKQGMSGNIVDSVVATAVDLPGYKYAEYRFPGPMDLEAIKRFHDQVRAKLGNAAVVTASMSRGSGAALIDASGNVGAVDAGFDANKVIQSALPAIDGRGGGKPTMAHAGGKKPEGLDDALLEIRRALGLVK